MSFNKAIYCISFILGISFISGPSSGLQNDNHIIGKNQIDMDLDGSIDFQYQISGGANPGGSSLDIRLIPSSSASVTYLSGKNVAQNLSMGTEIGFENTWSNIGDMIVIARNISSTNYTKKNSMRQTCWYGPFACCNGYIGLRLQSGDEYYFGWVQIMVDCNNMAEPLSTLDFFISSKANQVVICGEKY